MLLWILWLPLVCFWICCGKVPNRMLGCINKGISGRERNHYSTLLSACQVTPGILCIVLVLAKQNICGQVREGPPRWKLPYGERLRKLDLFGLRGNLITMFQYLKGDHKEDGDFLSIRNHMGKGGVTANSLFLGKFQLDMRKMFCNKTSEPLD